MKRLLFLLVALGFLACSCSTSEQRLLKDKRYMRFLESRSNCCLKVIDESNCQGLVVDASCLSKADKQLDAFIRKLTATDSNDVLSYNNFVSDTLINKFEKVLIDSVASSSNHFFKDICKNSYYRQYVGFKLKGKNYLLVGFEQKKPFKRKRDRKNDFKIFELTYSRFLLIDNIDAFPTDVSRFWILYDVENRIFQTFTLYKCRMRWVWCFEMLKFVFHTLC